ncbi:MAG: hypothetical protein AAF580_04795 [Pseudomonadota bacterium]
MSIASALPMTAAQAAIAVMVLICVAWLVVGPFVGRMAMRRAGLYGARRATQDERNGVRAALLFAPVVSLMGWGALLVLFRL